MTATSRSQAPASDQQVDDPALDGAGRRRIDYFYGSSLRLTFEVAASFFGAYRSRFYRGGSSSNRETIDTRLVHALPIRSGACSVYNKLIGPARRDATSFIVAFVRLNTQHRSRVRFAFRANWSCRSYLPLIASLAGRSDGSRSTNSTGRSWAACFASFTFRALRTLWTLWSSDPLWPPRANLRCRDRRHLRRHRCECCCLDPFGSSLPAKPNNGVLCNLSSLYGYDATRRMSACPKRKAAVRRRHYLFNFIQCDGCALSGVETSPYSKLPIGNHGLINDNFGSGAGAHEQGCNCKTNPQFHIAASTHIRTSPKSVPILREADKNIRILEGCNLYILFSTYLLSVVLFTKGTSANCVTGVHVQQSPTEFGRAA